MLTWATFGKVIFEIIIMHSLYSLGCEINKISKATYIKKRNKILIGMLFRPTGGFLVVTSKEINVQCQIKSNSIFKANIYNIIGW